MFLILKRSITNKGFTCGQILRENQKITALIIVLVSLLLTWNRYTPFDTDHVMSNDKFLTKSATFPTNSNSKIADTNNHDSSSSTITQKITVSSPQEYGNIFQWFYKKGITLESKGKKQKFITQLIFTCSKSRRKTLEKCVKYV